MLLMLVGPHAGYNASDNGLPTPKGEGNLETGAQLGLWAATAHMNLESIVIACHHHAVNTVPSLCTHRPSQHARWPSERPVRSSSSIIGSLSGLKS